MEKSGKLFVLICIFFLIAGCNTKKSLKPETINTNNRLKLILCINPTKDCLTCTQKAINALDRVLPPGEEILVFFKFVGTIKLEDVENFKTYINTTYPKRSFSYTETNLNLPHPAVFLAKDNVVFMQFVISMDQYEFNVSLNMAMDFLAGLSKS